MNIFINSNDRSSNDSDSQFRVTLNQTIPKNSKVFLEYCTLVNTFYQITDKNNDISTSLSSTALIGEGSYTLAELLLEIDTVLELETGETWTVTFDDITNQVELTSTAAFTLNDTALWRQLGFTDFSSSVSVQTSEVAPELLTVRSVLIDIEELPCNWSTAATNTASFTYVVPNAQSKNSMVLYQRNNGFDQYAEPRQNTSRLTIRVRDDRGHILSSLAAWQMVLSVVPCEQYY